MADAMSYRWTSCYVTAWMLLVVLLTILGKAT